MRVITHPAPSMTPVDGECMAATQLWSSGSSARASLLDSHLVSAGTSQLDIQW